MSDLAPTQASDEVVEQRGVKRFVTDTIVVAYATASAYLIAFAFNTGYASAFRIPRNLVGVDLPDILVSLAAMASVGWIALVVINQLGGLLMMLPGYLARKIVNVVLAVSLASLMYWGYPGTPRLLGALLFVWAAAVAAMEFGLPLLTRDGTHGYLPKLKAQYENVRGVPTLMHWAEERAPEFLLGAFLTLVLAWFAGVYGHGLAVRQDTFLVREGSPRLVCLLTSRDRVILAPLSIDGHHVEPVFRIVALPSGIDDQFRLTKTGRLKTTAP